MKTILALLVCGALACSAAMAATLPGSSSAMMAGLSAAQTAAQPTPAAPAPSSAPASASAASSGKPALSPPSVELPAELGKVLRDYEKAWIAGDTAALAALFTADGYALPNGQPAAAGVDAIRAAYQRNAGQPLVLRALHFAQSGDMAYIIGGFGFAVGEPDFGKFVLVLRRGREGGWRIAADMDNGNSAPRAGGG